MPRVELPLIICFAVGLLGQQNQQKGPVNLDFKESELGQMPTGWLAPVASKGFPAVATDQCTKSGNRCAVLRSEKVSSPGPFGNLMQSFDAAAYRNRLVRFRASARVESPGSGRAQLWLRVDRPNHQMGFFDNMGDRPIVSADWNNYEINGEVTDDALAIALGVILVGGEGVVYIDNVSFEITGTIRVASVIERSRPLSRRGLDNLTALAHLYGYIRHFHPSDAVVDADWDTLAIESVRTVEDSADPADLARKLGGFFHPVAPAVRAFVATEPAPKLELGSGTKMISWRHHGFGTGNPQSIYKSERVTADAPGGNLPPPFSAELGGGVKALVPLALFVDEKGTLPHSGAPATRDRTVTIRYTVNDRATRIADVIIAWNIFQHFYPYFDVVQTDWPKALAMALQSAAADRDEREFTLTLRRLVASLKDGHGSVAPGPEGVPAPVAWDWVEDRLVVTHVPDAQGQPIERGDAILSINGKPVPKALVEIEALTSGATPQWLRYKALNELGLGPMNQPIALETESFRDPSRHHAVTLKRVADGPKPPEPRPEKINEIKPGIFYVDLTRISDEDWQAALPKLEKAYGIVFDLRGYPSLSANWLMHISEKPMTSPQWHVPEVTVPDHTNMVFSREGEWDLEPEKPYLKAKRAVLTNAGAMSYGESTMGIVEHYKLAEIVGSTTAGTNGNVNPFGLPGGYTLYWTGMKVLKHDGSQHHGVGIEPTIPVSRTRAGIAAGHDEVLERGIRAVE